MFLADTADFYQIFLHIKQIIRTSESQPYIKKNKKKYRYFTTKESIVSITNFFDTRHHYWSCSRVVSTAYHVSSVKAPLSRPFLSSLWTLSGFFSQNLCTHECKVYSGTTFTLYTSCSLLCSDEQFKKILCHEKMYHNTNFAFVGHTLKRKFHGYLTVEYIILNWFSQNFIHTVV